MACRTERSRGRPVRLKTGSCWRSGSGSHRSAGRFAASRACDRSTQQCPAAVVVAVTAAIALQAEAREAALAVQTTAAVVFTAAETSAEAASRARAARALAAAEAAEAVASQAARTAEVVRQQADAVATQVAQAATRAAEVVVSTMAGQEAEAVPAARRIAAIVQALRVPAPRGRTQHAIVTATMMSVASSETVPEWADPARWSRPRSVRAALASGRPRVPNAPRGDRFRAKRPRLGKIVPKGPIVNGPYQALAFPVSDVHSPGRF